MKESFMARRVTKPHPIPDTALDADIAILGKKGRGKTFTAKGLVERLLQMQRRVLVLDPLSVWWGLKSGADGRSPGFPIPIFGGPHADIPLHDGAVDPNLPLRPLSIASSARPRSASEKMRQRQGRLSWRPCRCQSNG
jgi:hypothetical protein